jgi:hypothetical protein
MFQNLIVFEETGMPVKLHIQTIPISAPLSGIIPDSRSICRNSFSIWMLNSRNFSIIEGDEHHFIKRYRKLLLSLKKNCRHRI